MFNTNQLKSTITIAAIATITSFSSLLGATAALKREVSLQDLVGGAIASLVTGFTTLGAAASLQKETVVERFIETEPLQPPTPIIHNITLINAPQHADVIVEWARKNNLSEVKNGINN